MQLLLKNTYLLDIKKENHKKKARIFPSFFIPKHCTNRVFPG